MRRLLILTTLLVPAALAAPAAHAATVQYQDEPRKVRYDAAPGETNRLTITQAGQTVTLTDPGASGMAIAKDDTDCTVVSPTEARCVVPVAGFRVDADLGDLDDQVTARNGVRESIACGDGIDGGEADVEDTLEGCEAVAQPLAPSALGDNGLHLGHLPKPERGKSVAVGVKNGVILVRRPGATASVPLDPAQPVPVGSVLDATRGTLSLTVATPTGVARAAQAGAAPTQTADFTGSQFVVGQAPGAAQTELRMTGGDFSACGATARSAARGTAFAAASRKRVRSLWGSGKGRFTTRGKNSSATVRGTIWRVTDRCDGTLTTVTRGVVVVHDHVRNRTKVVKAGESYLVRRGATAKRR